MTYSTKAALKQTHSGPLTDPPINSFANIRFQQPGSSRPGAPAQSGNHPGSCSLKNPVVWSGWELPHDSFVDVFRPPLAVALLLGEQQGLTGAVQKVEPHPIHLIQVQIHASSVAQKICRTSVAVRTRLFGTINLPLVDHSFQELPWAQFSIPGGWLLIA